MRRLLLTLIMVAAATAAHADVWMVKGSGTLGCRTRDDIAAKDTAGGVPQPDGATKGACLPLYAGERLLEQTEVGVGFNTYMRVERHDGSILFVPASALVADPGTGSMTDNRGQ